MNFEECLKRGLIKRDLGATERVRSSLRVAERFLESAKRNFEIEDYEMVEIAAYNSAFHSMRALLFAKGYKERSHHCLAVGVRELYKKDQKLLNYVNIFDKLRISRHSVQYGGALVSKEEAEFVLKFANDLLKAVRMKIGDLRVGRIE